MRSFRHDMRSPAYPCGRSSRLSSTLWYRIPNAMFPRGLFPVSLVSFFMSKVLRRCVERSTHAERPTSKLRVPYRRVRHLRRSNRISMTWSSCSVWATTDWGSTACHSIQRRWTACARCVCGGRNSRSVSTSAFRRRPYPICTVRVSGALRRVPRSLLQAILRVLCGPCKRS